MPITLVFNESRLSVGAKTLHLFLYLFYLKWIFVVQNNINVIRIFARLSVSSMLIHMIENPRIYLQHHAMQAYFYHACAKKNGKGNFIS